jgi:hypothetical protein
MNKYIFNKPGIAELIFKDANLDFNIATTIATSPTLGRIKLKNMNLYIDTQVV